MHCNVTKKQKGTVPKFYFPFICTYLPVVPTPEEHQCSKPETLFISTSWILYCHRSCWKYFWWAVSLNFCSVKYNHYEQKLAGKIINYEGFGSSINSMWYNVPNTPSTGLKLFFIERRVFTYLFSHTDNKVTAIFKMSVT